MIDRIFRLKNNIVMVFDEQGEQLPEYQGSYKNVHEKILASAPTDAVFNNWFGKNIEPEVVPWERW
jgi:hypothetical protein